MDPLKCTSSGDTLFDGEVTVRVAENGVGISSSSSRTLRLLVQLCDKSSGSKELLVRLTDEQDPFTLYTCLVCDDDYLALRQHQGLLIDFVAFPHKFVDLVNTCLREKQNISPRFMLVLKCSSDGGSSTLEVVEVNVFKHLCHLALNLAPASTQLKLTYLADCCKALKAKAASKEREMVDMEQQMNQQVQHLQGIVNKTSSEVQHLRSKMDQQTAMSSERQAQRLSKEREKMLKLQSDADRKADRERRELEARLNNRIEHLQAKVASLTTENSEISERRHRAESSVKELRGRLSNVEGELERCRQELTHTKKHNAHLDQDYQAKCKMSRDLEARTAHLEAELMSKEGSLTHTQQLMASLQQQKVGLEEALEERRQKLAKRENSIQLLYAELQKSLDVIKKLQKKVREEHLTSKVRGAALVEQDKVVGEKDSKVMSLNDQLQETTTKLSQLTLDNDKLQNELRETLEKLQEQDKTLKTNENVIAWLNKQLNEVEMTGAIVKRAPLTEAYLTSQGPTAHGLLGSHGFVSHSTPLSNTIRSFPTITSISGGTHTSVGSFRPMSNIPPIPEEISPRSADTSPPQRNSSPPNKENVHGLDLKYLEPTHGAAVPVQGLLRANYLPVPEKKSQQRNKAQGKKEEPRGRGKPIAKGNLRETNNAKRPDGIGKKPSSYFPRT